MGNIVHLLVYFPKLLKIHRTKLEKSDSYIICHLTLKPEIETVKDIKEMKVYGFKLPQHKVDLVISGIRVY